MTASHRTSAATRRLVTTVAVACVGALLVSTAPGSVAQEPTSQSPHRSAGRASIDNSALRQLLQRQGLPTTETIPITATSHPFNGAAWQNKPIDLGDYGYVEREFYLSGRANVYDWIPGSNYDTDVIAAGPYTTRMDVRRPKDMDDWSGKVVVEMINMSAGWDWTAVWSALWQRVLADGDIYIGLTSKPNVLPGMKKFDAERYAPLSWRNPVPRSEQECGLLPGDEGYDPNLSKLYENGLVWDMVTQTGRLLKSRSADNPLGAPAKTVILSGESQSANYLLTYFRYFTPSALLTNGDPVYDGYFAETQVGITGAPINQCAPTVNPLPEDDAQATTFPRRQLPWFGINSGWDYPGVRGWTAPPDANTPHRKVRFWELAGANHGWEWQYLYGDATADDLIAAGFWDPASYAWSCGPNNPEVPVEVPEKAGYVGLKRWIRTGDAPPRAPRILTTESDTIDTTLYDPLGNAMGGLRMPMVDVPVASFGPGQYALTGDCPEIEPFDTDTLTSLYPSRRHYLEEYAAATRRLVAQGFVLKADAPKLLKIAKRVRSIPVQGS